MNVAPVITNSVTTLAAEVVDCMAAQGAFTPIARYPVKDRERARRMYIDNAIAEVRRQAIAHNRRVTSKEQKWAIPTTLSEVCIARIIAIAENAKRLRSDPRIDAAQSALAIYDPETGVYTYDHSYHYQIVAQYYPASSRAVNGVLSVLECTAPSGLVNQDPNLVNFANGVLDRKNKVLLPHDPKYNFSNALAVRYNPNAKNKHFTDHDGEDWDVESWMAGLSDDPSVVDVLWEVVAACLRPGERWNKTPWLYSVVGANGKGSLCELIRRIVGATATASLTVADFGQDFMVSQLMNTTCVVTDENPVGTVIDKLSAYKAAVTGDIFTINRKYRDPIRFTYSGLILQCMNSMPEARDRTGSFYRRQLFIPMEKNFADHDKPEIKRDFLTDPEVCEYVAKRCMDMEFTSFSNPARCAEVLDEYKTYNDVCREFFRDVIDQIPWDFIPNQFALDLYRKWMERNYAGQTPLGRNKFLADFRQAAKEAGWITPPANTSTTTTGFDMTAECALLYEYDLDQWNQKSTSSNINKIMQKACTLDPRSIKKRMPGIIRNRDYSPAARAGVVDYDEDEVTFIEADKVIETNANIRRDYGLDSDDRISLAVAAQLAADPDCAAVEPDLDIQDLIIETTGELDDARKELVGNLIQQLAAIMSVSPDEQANLIRMLGAASPNA